MLHVTYTREVPIFEDFRSLVRAPRGSWQYDDKESFTGDYFNSNRKNLPVCVYDKAQQFRDEGKRLPNDVRLTMDDDEHPLFRFEARLNQSPCSQLKARGGWNRSYLLAEDLIQGSAFVSALKYLQWKFERHVPIPSLRLPALGKNPSPRSYAAHNARETAYENPERLKERAIADHNAGMINNIVLRAELDRADLLERRARTLSLHATLAEECKKLIEEILVGISGNITTVEIEHAPRELRHTHILS
jgi:hypothetical protein